MLSVREYVLVVATYILNPRIVDCVDTWLNLAEVCLIAVAYESEVCEVEHVRTENNLVVCARSLLAWSVAYWEWSSVNTVELETCYLDVIFFIARTYRRNLYHVSYLWIELYLANVRCFTLAPY